MAERDTIEIHKTEYVDRDLPTITYESSKSESMTEGERTYISVSDKTSERALTTFKALLKEIAE